MGGVLRECNRLLGRGRVRSLHLNDSQTPLGSNRDRHANLHSGTIDPGVIVSVLQAAGSPVICETPDPWADVRWLRGQLASER